MSGLTKADLIVAGDEDEPRIMDLRVAERLGFPTNRLVRIRDLIARNLTELETYGPLPRHAVKGPGRTGSAYLLNEAQILVTAMKSDAPNAVAIRKEVIEVYQAWRRGKIGVLPAGMAELLAHLEARQDEKLAQLRADMLRIAENHDGTSERSKAFMLAVDILNKAGVPPKGRKGLSGRCSKLLLKMAVREQRLNHVRTSTETGRYQFHVDLVNDWMHAEGGEVFRAHNAKITGQTVMDFNAEKKKRGPKG